LSKNLVGPKKTTPIFLVGTGGFDSSPMWIRNRADLTNSFVENPDYLKQNETEFDEDFHQINLRDWTVPFGRKFRSIRVWLCLKWSGKEGIQNITKQHIKLAKIFENLVRKHGMPVIIVFRFLIFFLDFFSFLDLVFFGFAVFSFLDFFWNFFLSFDF